MRDDARTGAVAVGTGKKVLKYLGIRIDRVWLEEDADDSPRLLEWDDNIPQ